MTVLSILQAAGCRTDGVQLNPDGSIAFLKTNAGGAWTQAQQNAVLAALGLLPQVLTPAQQQAAAAAAIQAWLDATAKSFGYDSMLSAVSYANSSVSLWQRQAVAFAAWRDAVFNAAIALLEASAAGTTAAPASAAALIAALPQPDIPTS